MKKVFATILAVIYLSTSIGANVKEAQNAESKPDFIHKMKIAAKEANETSYWLSDAKNQTFPGFSMN